MTLLSVKQDVLNSMESQAISLGRGQAEVTLLFVRQDVVTSMERLLATFVLVGKKFSRKNGTFPTMSSSQRKNLTQ